VGSLTRSKGVGDILDALAYMKLQIYFKAYLSGKGEMDFFKDEVIRLNLSDQVH
jgi:glycosyltransferase involved in cell wall biosynthesis